MLGIILKEAVVIFLESFGGEAFQYLGFVQDVRETLALSTHSASPLSLNLSAEPT
jgi:hypothetical protein